MKINHNIPQPSQQNIKNSNTSGETANETGGLKSADNNFAVKPQTPQTNETAKNINSALNQINSTKQNLEAKFNDINIKQQSRLIKELFNFPDDIQELLKLLMNDTTSEDTTAKTLIKFNQTINIDLMKEFLENGSKQSVDKLIKLFQQAPGGTQNTDQLKELMALLNQIAVRKDSTHQEVLTNLILLYLPWHPLAENQDLKIKFEKRQKEDKQESEEIAVIIYISTINLGEFKISISLNGLAVKIQVENYDKQEISENDKENYLKKIIKEIGSKMKEDKIQATTELLISEPKAQKDNCEKNQQQERKREAVISTVGKISALVIITAQKVAKIILELDEKISLIKKRKEIIN